MKKAAAKKPEWEYRCFTCLKQDDKARKYTRSYDLLLHMVNTHRKFPVDAKHNTYYAADGSDIRDATREEIEKYRLAALHKRKKPDADAGAKSGSSASGVRLSGPESERPRRMDDRSRGRESSRDRERDRGSRNREAERKDSRTSSREAKRDRGTSSTERRTTNAKEDERAKEKEATGVSRRTAQTKADVRARAKDKETLPAERSRTKAGNELIKEKEKRPDEDKERTRAVT